MITTTPVVNTVFKDLPTTVAGYSVENDDASYTIIINARMSHERAIKAYEHEMYHILENDFDSVDTVEEIEIRRHGGII